MSLQENTHIYNYLITSEHITFGCKSIEVIVIDDWPIVSQYKPDEVMTPGL